MTAVAGQLFDVVVLGAGPAGAAAAAGLARLGHSVTLVSRTRAPSVEGLSMRALNSLTEAGLERAAASASEPAARLVYWAGQRSMRGQECLLKRDVFDARLVSDLRGGGVTPIDSTVRNFEITNNVWQVETTSGVVCGRTVLDARGRRARRSDRRGPLLVAWNTTYQTSERSAPGSAVAALDEGWCWIARTADGLLSLQFVGAAGEQLSSEAARLQAAVRALPAFGEVLNHAAPVERATARAAVARYSRPSQGLGFLRIGDAAVAMDPLSGNGVHEAVRSARVAVAALNSYLRGAHWPVVARFVDERAAELWRRCVTAAAGFYRLQADYSRSEFWVRTASAYEAAMRQAAVAEEGPGRFEMRPVLDGERIEIRQVWVSPEWPRGVWNTNRGLR